MKTKGSILRNKGSLWALSLAALLAVGTPAFAQHGGGGGGGHGGGGGGHVGGGGGGHASGFGGGHAGGFAGGHAAGFGGYRGGYAGGGVHYAPRVGYSAGRGGVASVRTYGRSGFVGRPGYAYGRGGFGFNRGYWGGGYWRGGYWPRAYYGWGYPLFLGVLPAVYATYWWGGVPYYYANDVYYTYNPSQQGYVVTDPPPVDNGDSDSAGGNGNYNSAEPGQVQSNDSTANTNSSNVYAYPKSGQTDEQQSTDRYECHKWAVAQSGFDPTHTSQASGNSADYRRAMTACLDGRGYSAN
jgi:hypothetical protein